MSGQTHLTSAIRITDLEVRDDGSVIEGQIVPFNIPAVVTELGLDGKVRSYREMFAPGSFTHMEQQYKRGGASWVSLNFEHKGDMIHRLGFAKRIWQTDEGASAEFHLYERDDLSMIKDMARTSHRGMSIEFRDRVEPQQTEAGIVVRRQVHVDAVAMTDKAAYVDAAITGVRHQDEPYGTPLLDELKEYLDSLRVPE